MSSGVSQHDVLNYQPSFLKFEVFKDENVIYFSSCSKNLRKRMGLHLIVIVILNICGNFTSGIKDETR